MNLYELLPEHEKKVMDNYITEHIITPEHYIGNKVFLEHWSKSKTKLYHILGNKFVHKVPYEKEVTLHELRQRMTDLSDTHKFCYDYARFIKELWYCDLISEELRSRLLSFINSFTLADNAINSNIELNALKDKKVVKLQKGTKVFKAFTKVLTYFSTVKQEVLDYAPSMESLERFRCAHSMVLNEKVTRGNLVFSILPMDFITMSDNGYNWSSCMSWIGHGCYHMGSEEMMNSNNVICCYLESDNKPLFCFKGIKPNGRSQEVYSPKEYPDYSYTNKKWRVLFYVTKDIISSGKAYPRDDQEMVKTALVELRRLAAANMNWKYDYGPQLYLDHMRFYEDNFDLTDVFYSHPNKKRILFDTQAMYHDMINDHDRDYWCVRNAVKKPKLISISGKVRCLCCGTDDLREDPDYDYREGYNDRVHNTNSLICTPCLEKYFYCEMCDAHSGNDEVEYFANKPMHLTKKHGKVCHECYTEKLKLCPCCGEEFHVENDTDSYKAPLIRFADATIPPHFENIRSTAYYYRAYKTAKEYSDNCGYVPLMICKECVDKFAVENGFMSYAQIKNPYVVDQNSVERFKENAYNPNYDLTHYGQYIYPYEVLQGSNPFERFMIKNLKDAALKEE